MLDGHGRPAPIGVAGELMLAGLGAPAGASEDPFAGGPAVRTGDRARWLADRSPAAALTDARRFDTLTGPAGEVLWLHKSLPSF